MLHFQISLPISLIKNLISSSKGSYHVAYSPTERRCTSKKLAHKRSQRPPKASPHLLHIKAIQYAGSGYIEIRVKLAFAAQ